MPTLTEDLSSVWFLSVLAGIIKRMFDAMPSATETTGRFVDDNVEWVPENLEQVPPGAVLAAILDHIDIGACSGYDRVRVLEAHERMRSHYAARSYHAMSKVAEAIDPDDMVEDMVDKAAAAEIAAALRLTRKAADIEMSLALELQHRLPDVWDALCDGAIDVRRARILIDDTVHLGVGTARLIVAGLLRDSCRMTSGQLRARIRKLCIGADPDDAGDRYRHAVEDRRVIAAPTIDGTADLHAFNLPPHRVHAALRRIHDLAQELHSNGDKRSMDQLRADVLLDLLEGHGHAVGKGTVVIHTDLETLTRLANHHADLAGYGPVVADIARQVAEHQRDTQWRWALVDPDTGLAIDGGVTRRRPTTAQRRRTETLRPTCVHPGCRMPAVDCDIDHTTPWADTHTTNTDDLAPLCRYHHRIRHQTRWTYQARPGGDYTFTSHLGHTYTTSGRDP